MTAAKDAAPQPLSEKSEPWRNLFIILWFNAPLAALYLLFDLWRVLAGQFSATDPSNCDFVCDYTRRYGDVVPIVSSAKAKLVAAGSKIDVDLAREILFFNYITWLSLVPVSVLAFVYYVHRFGIYRVRKVRTKGAIPQLLALAVLFWLLAIMVAGPLETKDSILADWTGLLLYNVGSLIFSIALMILVVLISEWRAGAREKRNQKSS